MRTVSNTPDRLVIEDRPRVLAITLWLMGLGALFAAVSGQTDGIAETLLVFILGTGVLCMAWYFFPFQRFTFDRTVGAFTRRIARVTGATVETLELDQIERAALQSQWNDGTRMDRVALLTKSGPFPLEFGFVNARRAPVVSDINSWLEQEG